MNNDVHSMSSTPQVLSTYEQQTHHAKESITPAIFSHHYLFHWLTAISKADENPTEESKGKSRIVVSKTSVCFVGNLFDNDPLPLPS